MRTVPRVRRGLLVGGFLVGAVICCAFIALSRRPGFELSLARVLDVRDTNVLSALDWRFPILDTNDDWVVVMRARNADRRTLWFGPEEVQLKVQGRWLEPQKVAWLNSKYFCARVFGRSQQDFVVAVVPHNTEVVRLMLTYLPEPVMNWAHNSSRSYAYNAQSRFQRVEAALLMRVDRWAIEPLWRWDSSKRKEWPSRIVEFALGREGGSGRAAQSP
jgi:hypothetical protein